MAIARVFNLILAVWLFLSGFFWTHSRAQFWNALICGILIAAFAWLAATTAPNARWGNTAVGAWLVLSTFFLPWLRAGTAWNHVVVGALVLMLSLFPSASGATQRRSRRPSPYARGAA
jgi:hypothetical protein